MARKAYKKPRLIPPGKASELAKADIKHSNIKNSSKENIIEDFILKIDMREFENRIKEKLKEIEEEEK